MTITFRSGRRDQQPAQVAEQEVDVEAAFVRLVEDDRVVAQEVPVVLDLGEQYAVGHQLHQGPVTALIVESHRVADGVAESVPSSSAIRWATVRAASRRGWV